MSAPRETFPSRDIPASAADFSDDDFDLDILFGPVPIPTPPTSYNSLVSPEGVVDLSNDEWDSLHQSLNGSPPTPETSQPHALAVQSQFESILASSFSLPIDISQNNDLLSSTFQSNSTLISPPNDLAEQLEAAKLRIAQLTSSLQQEENETAILENRNVALSHQLELLRD